jgi:hypothetical protein
MNVKNESGIYLKLLIGVTIGTKVHQVCMGKERVNAQDDLILEKR